MLNSLDEVSLDNLNNFLKISDVWSKGGHGSLLDLVNTLVEYVGDADDAIMNNVVGMLHKWALGHLVEDGDWELSKEVDGVVEVSWHVLVKTVVLEGNGEELDHEHGTDQVVDVVEDVVLVNEVSNLVEEVDDTGEVVLELINNFLNVLGGVLNDVHDVLEHVVLWSSWHVVGDLVDLDDFELHLVI